MTKLKQAPRVWWIQDNGFPNTPAVCRLSRMLKVKYNWIKVKEVLPQTKVRVARAKGKKK